MTRPVLPRSLLAIQPPAIRRRLARDVLEDTRDAACPPSERAALASARKARTAHARQGASARRGGEKGERLIHKQLDAAVARGLLAWWRAVGPPTKRVRRNGRVELIAVGVGPCDVIAQTTDGRCLVIEIKRGSRLWRSELERGTRRDPALAQHQSDHLAAAHDGGGIALVAAVLDGPRWLRWGSIGWRDDGSLRARDVAHAPTTLAEILEER